MTRNDLRKLTVLIEKISEGKVEHLSELQEVEKLLDEYNVKGKGSVNTKFQAEIIYDYIIHRLYKCYGMYIVPGIELEEEITEYIRDKLDIISGRKEE